MSQRTKDWLAMIGVGMALNMGCGTVIEHYPVYLDDGVSGISMVGYHDCATALGARLDTYIAENTARPELHIIGIDKSIVDSVADPGYGEVTITVERSGPLKLVLTAREPTRWNVHALDSDIIEVILTGYGDQKIGSIDGLVKDITTNELGRTLGNSYHWPSERELQHSSGLSRRKLEELLAETMNLRVNAEYTTEADLTSFHGCRFMSNFILTEGHPMTAKPVFTP